MFRDVQSEIILTLLGRNARRCPKCHKGYIRKKESVIEHYAWVAAIKFAGMFTGGGAPAPDYTFICPVCQARFKLNHETAKFIHIPFT